MSTATAHHDRNENMQDSFFFRCHSYDFRESNLGRWAEESKQWSENDGMQFFIFCCTLHCVVLEHFLSSSMLRVQFQDEMEYLVPDPRSIEDRGFQVPRVLLLFGVNGWIPLEHFQMITPT